MILILKQITLAYSYGFLRVFFLSSRRPPLCILSLLCVLPSPGVPLYSSSGWNWFMMCMTGDMLMVSLYWRRELFYSSGWNWFMMCMTGDWLIVSLYWRRELSMTTWLVSTGSPIPAHTTIMIIS